MHDENVPLVHDIEELQTILRSSERHVRHLISSGALAKVPGMGRKVLVSHTALLRFVNGEE